jgi:hypothetical protein
MGLILKIVSLVFLLFFLLSVLIMVVTFRRPRKVSVPSQFLSVAISLVTLTVFASLAGFSASGLTWTIMIFIGVPVGYFWARTTQVFDQNGSVMSRNSGMYLMVWGAIFALNQLITIITNRPPEIAMALLIVSTASVWGTAGSILKRYYGIRSRLQPASTGLMEGAAAWPAGAGQPGQASRGTSSPSITPRPNSCPRCGAVAEPGDNFCTKCGKQVQP